MRMKSLSVSFLKTPPSTICGRLLVGRWAIAFKASSVTGVSFVIKGFINGSFQDPNAAGAQGLGNLFSEKNAKKKRAGARKLRTSALCFVVGGSFHARVSREPRKNGGQVS